MLAVDIGGTKLEAALVDAEGRIVPGSRARVATGRDADPARMRRALEEAIGTARAARPDALAGVGVGTAGPLDLDAGTVAPVNMPGLAGFPLRATIAELVDAPVELALDGQCIALAESRLGAGRGAGTMLGMVVSTGVGGGLVADGRRLGGATGNAGHVGQVRASERDAEGRLLTVEDIASGPASVAWARAQGWQGTSGEELAAGWARGETIPREAVARSARAVGLLIADVWTLLDLDVAVIGGGFSRVSPDYVEQVAATAAGLSLLPYTRSPRVVRAELGDDAPLVGAASLVMRG